MINQDRRNALKTIAAASAAVVAPAVASAAIAQPERTSMPSVPGTDLQLKFGKSPTGQVISLNNTSSGPITLKHVSPGIVHAEGRTYDINSVLSQETVTVNAGSTVELPINPIAVAATEQPLPSGLTVSRAFTVSTDVNTTVGTTSVTTLRSYLA